MPYLPDSSQYSIMVFAITIINYNQGVACDT